MAGIPAIMAGYVSTAGTPSLGRSASAAGVGAIVGGVAGVKFAQPPVDIAHIETEAALGKPEHNGFVGTLQKPYLIHTRRGFMETDYVPIRGGHVRMLARPDLAAKDPAMFARYRAQRGRMDARVGRDQTRAEAISNAMDRASNRIDKAVSPTVKKVENSKWLNKLAGSGF